MAIEKRPELFITYAYDDPENAPVVDVSGSVKEARRQGNSGGFLYRVKRLEPPDERGVYAYGNESFIEVLR